MSNGFLSSELPLIGREREFAKLRKNLESAIAGNGRTVFLVGEPGVGKTKILKELANFGKNKNVKTLVGNSFSDGTPYHPFSEAFSEYMKEPLLKVEDFTYIDEVFVVDKSGILLSYASSKGTSSFLPSGEGIDKAVIGGMLTAVQDFVKDAFHASEGALNRLEYQKTKILLEHGDLIFIAGVVRGEENVSMRSDIKKMVYDIESEYGDLLRNWNGDVGKMNMLSERIVKLTENKYPVRRRLEDVYLEAERIKIFEKVTGMVEAISQNTPLLLIIEDVHWADISSLLLLQYLARNITNYRVLICVSYREDELDDEKRRLLESICTDMGGERCAEGGCEKIELTCLENEKTTELVENYLGTKISEHIALLIQGYTSGNPFYVKEFLQAISEEEPEIVGKLEYNSIVRMKIPFSASEIILKRLSRLSEEEIRIIEYAAIFREPFDCKFIANCVDSEENKISQLLERLVSKKFLALRDEKEKKMQIIHTLLKDIVSDSMSPLWKKLTYKKIGIVLENLYKNNLDAVIYQLADIYRNTNEYKKSVEYNLRAGDKAVASFAPTEALKYYKECLASLEHLSDTIENVYLKMELLERVGDVYTWLGNYEDAIKSFATAKNYAQDYAEDRIAVAKMHRKISSVYEISGEYENALAEISNSIELLKGSKCVELGRAYLTNASICCKKGILNSAMEFCNKASEYFRAFSSDENDFAQLYHVMGNIYFNMGEYEASCSAYLKSLEVRKKIQDFRGIAMLYNNIGIVYRNKGNYELALEYHNKCLEITKKMHDLYGISTAYRNIGMVYFRKEDYTSSLNAYQESLMLRKKIGDTVGIAKLYEELGKVYEQNGELDTAIRCMEESSKLKSKIDPRDYALKVECFL